MDLHRKKLSEAEKDSRSSGRVKAILIFEILFGAFLVALLVLLISLFI